MKSFASASSACAVAVLVLMSSLVSSLVSSVPTSERRPVLQQSSAVDSSAALRGTSARQVSAGQRVTVAGRVPKRLARAKVTLSLTGTGSGRRQRVDTERVDARRRYVLRGRAPLASGVYAYAVRVRNNGSSRTVKRFKVTVVDASATPTPTTIPTTTPTTGSTATPATGPKGDPNDWTYLGGTRVARWDPCNTITWSVEGSAPYAAAKADLDTAFARISAATGLSFARVADPAVSTFDVVWTNAASEPRLEGSVVGVGGFSSYKQTVGPSKVASGWVLLDVEHTLSAGFDAVGGSWGKVMLHEMTHAVGLGHAVGVEQIMYPKVAATTAEFGAGDLTGLTAVGASQGCFPAGSTQGRRSATTLAD